MFKKKNKEVETVLKEMYQSLIGLQKGPQSYIQNREVDPNRISPSIMGWYIGLQGEVDAYNLALENLKNIAKSHGVDL